MTVVLLKAKISQFQLGGDYMRNEFNNDDSHRDFSKHFLHEKPQEKNYYPFLRNLERNEDFPIRLVNLQAPADELPYFQKAGKELEVQVSLLAVPGQRMLVIQDENQPIAIIEEGRLGIGLIFTDKLAREASPFYQRVEELKAQAANPPSEEA